MVKVPFENDDDQPENANRSDPIGSLGSEKEVWIDGNFSDPINFCFYPVSKMSTGFPRIEQLDTYGISTPQIVYMSAIIPADVEDDEPLKVFAITYNQGYEMYTTKTTQTDLQSLVFESEMEFYELEYLESWDEIEIGIPASFCPAELQAEIGLEMLQIME